MKKTTLILTLTATAILGLGCVSQGPKITSGKHEAAQQQVTVYYGDVPVTLTADSFQTSFNPAVLAY